MAMPGRDTDIYKVTLKSWLFERIELNETNENQVYPGLEWLDETRRVFKLPWVTESHPEWRKFYKLFHEWASREGRQSANSQKAKRNFRSALNHSKHFKHIQFLDKDLQTGSYKVYQFLTQEEINKSKPRNYSEDSGASQSTPESQDYVNTPNNGIMEASSIGEQNLMQQAVPVQQLEQYTNDLNIDPRYSQQWPQSAVQMPMNITDQEIGAVTEVETSGHVPLMSSTLSSFESEKYSSVFWGTLKDAGATPQNAGKCDFTVEYNGRNVQHDEFQLFDGPCMIIYGDENHAKQVEFLNMARDNPVFSNNIVSLRSPESEAPGLSKILQHMNTGIHLWFDKEKANIYMMRECLAHVYCFNMHDDRASEEDPGKPLQIKRKEHYVMFSYFKFVQEILDSIADPEIPKPSDKVEIIIGIQPKPDDRGKSVKGVKITIQPIGANYILLNDDPALLLSIKASSDLSSLDRALQQAQNSQQEQAMEH